MKNPFSADGPKQLLSELCRLAAQRVPTEAAINHGFQSRNAAADKAYQDGEQQRVEKYAAEMKAAQNEYREIREQLATRFDTEYAIRQHDFNTAKAVIAERFEADKANAEQELQTAHWDASSIAEAAKGGAGNVIGEVHLQLDTRWQELQNIHHQAVALLNRWGLWRDFVDPQPNALLLERHPVRRFCHALDLARAQFHTLASLALPRFFQDMRWMFFVFLLWIVTMPLAGSFFGWNHPDFWLPASAVGTGVVACLIGIPLGAVSRRRAAEHYLALRRTLLEAGADRTATLETAKADCQRLFEAIETRYQSELKRANERFGATMAALMARQDEAMAALHKKSSPRLEAIAKERAEEAARADAKYPPLFRDIDARYEAEAQMLRHRHTKALADSRTTYQEQWTDMAQRWNTGIEEFRNGLEEISTQCSRLFPDWNTSDWSRWTPPVESPPTFRYGQTEVNLARIHGGVPEDPRLRPAQTDFLLHTLLPAPQRSLMLLKAADQGRGPAVSALQSMMLRMLTSVPPGKVRFTIFDPVGLGENFSAFMHLTDYDELLVSSRIWADAEQIEQRLIDLTQHMENVIQLYLRNEFESIQQYNATAGEMAEPYRVLVAANFPANFTEVAVQRLKSIVASGARCGVFVLMSVDTNLPRPQHFRLPELEAEGHVLEWDNGRFIWKHPDYGPLTVAMEQPPPAERFTEIVRNVGRLVKEAGRVEVPFSSVIPHRDAWWTGDSRSGLQVPLGRAGALKLQNLELGQGTSQHVLISGKTGSGKSTLLHVLITNMALRYSPEEVELYLIDFKKGVEFKAYARHMLPHARVIAVESEREFGLSVLQRLDGELRERGDMFRRQGVQDLKGFRAAQPSSVLPRVMLVIDEFQELFIEDDRIGQESALLLDRLVRQGRAFGIHVLLGSQTLGGAYSLARSTIGQMAVRIALQCSESDAHLILSEENTAARLLTRPGEAIYNDANGMFEGNHPFQIVWLADSERDNYLEEIAQLAHRGTNGKPYNNGRVPIVFEGNVPAELSENPALNALLEAKSWPAVCREPVAWLGSAVAIKDPSHGIFSRQAGANLLLAGHRDEAALGVMSASLLGLASQLSPCPVGDAAGTQFYVLDGTRPEAPEAGYWKSLVANLPHKVTLGEIRDAPAIVAELAAEVARRQQSGGDNESPLYLFIYNMARFRDLRKEEEFSFGSDDKPPSTGKLFAAILRDGPSCGVHTIAWCDSYATVNRLLDRQSLRDFDMRVLFQMNATDSSSLMDAPDASRLGVHRAIYYHGGHGQNEKFRPYGLPATAWLDSLKRKLLARTTG